MNFVTISACVAVAPRLLRCDDLRALLRIQEACYDAGFIENAQVYARRLASPVNCSLAIEHDGQMCAYVAAYRSVLGKVTPLHGAFEHARAAPDTLYVHDMAVLPAFAGRGLARTLLEALWDRGREWGLHHSALVSVQGSREYWARHGYVAQPVLDAGEAARLASYGDSAIYMVRALDRG